MHFIKLTDFHRLFLQFYIKDTSSSNGTFVNNNRLSPANEDSPAREIYSNDIIQFGVEILDNATKITHGCIISRVKLFYPNGLEACKTPTMYNIPTENMLPAYYSYIQMLEKEQRIYQKLDDIEDVLQEAHLLADVTLLVKKKEELLMKELEVLQKTCDEETRHAQNLESKVEQLDGQLDRMVSEHEHDVIKLRSLSKMLKEKEIQEEHLQRRINSMIKSDHRLMTMLFLLLIIVFVIGGYDMIVVFSRLIY